MAYIYKHECRLDGFSLAQTWVVADQEAVPSKKCQSCGESVPVLEIRDDRIYFSSYSNSAHWEL